MSNHWAKILTTPDSTPDARPDTPQVPGLSPTLGLVVFAWLLALTVTWVYVLHQIDRSYERAVKRAEFDTRHLSALFQAQIRGTLSSADDLLGLLAFRAASGPHEAAELVPGLRADGEPYDRISFTDPQGFVIASSESEYVGARLSGREGFERAKAAKDSALLVGRPVLAGPHMHGIPLIRRIVSPDGRFAGVVEVLLSPVNLVGHFESVQLGGDGVVMLADLDGTIYARLSPAGVASENSEQGFDPGILERAREASWGTYFAASPIDAIERVVSYRTLEPHRLVVMVGKSADDVLQEHAPQSVNWIYTGGVISLLVSMVALLSMVLLRREHRSALAIANAFETEHANARTDPLTQLPNRRAFLDIVSAQMEYHRRQGETLSLAYFDCDRFKEVNDRLGHDAGDRCLIEVAIALGKGLRRSDYACRIGGDEFAALFPSTRVEDAAMVMERFRGRLAEQLAARNLPVTVSIGIVELESLDAKPEELMTQADAMMYRAKRAGGNRVESRQARAAIPGERGLLV